MNSLSSSLTPRDKKLLYALIFIVIIFIFGWCLIRPICKRIVATSEQIEIAESVKATNEAKVIGVSSAETVYNRFTDEAAASQADYYDLMDSSQIDKLVTTYILNKNLLARSLTIAMPKDYVSENPYIYSEPINNTAVYTEPGSDIGVTFAGDVADSTVDGKKKGGFEYFKNAVLGFLTGQNSYPIVIVPSPTTEYSRGLGNSSATEDSGIYCASVDILMEGNPETLQLVIDELTRNPSVRVTSFNWIKLDPITYLQEDGTILIYENQSRQLRISVNLYMVDRQ